MNKIKNFKLVSVIFSLLSIGCLVSCGGSDNKESEEDQTSEATIEYLCSTTFWYYLPDTGIKKGESTESYAFYRIGELQGCTWQDGSESKYYKFTLQAPVVTLKEMDMFNEEIEGGDQRTLTVYKLTRPKYKNHSEKWLQINGKPYVSTIGGGVDL